MVQKIVVCHGDKGGVGKSTLAMLNIEYFRSKGRNPLVVDGDQSNADVARLYDGALRINLKTSEGFCELVDLVNANRNRDVVINLPAQMGNEMRTLAPLFFEGLRRGQIDAEVICLFLLGRTRDSVQQLKIAMDSDPSGGMMRWVAVPNLFFGAHEKFGLWRNSKTRQTVLEKGREIVLPELADWVAAQLQGDPGQDQENHGGTKSPAEVQARGPQSPAELLQVGTLGVQTALSRWLNDGFTQLDKAFA